MADEALRARGRGFWIWALGGAGAPRHGPPARPPGDVGAATASVGALAVLQGNRAVPAVLPSQRAPCVVLPVLGGGKAALLQGKVTLVDFWATWCAPCRFSMPRVQKLWMEYKPRGLELYSIDTDDPAPDREDRIRAFLTENGLKFPVAIDDGTAEEAFAVSRLPTMLLLDR